MGANSRRDDDAKKQGTSADELDLLAIGKLGAPHGLRGEFRLNLYIGEGEGAIDLIDPAVADAGEETFVWLQAPSAKPSGKPGQGKKGKPSQEPPRREVVTSLRDGSKGLLIGIASVRDRTAAEAFPRCEVLLPRAALRETLEEDTYLGEDLVGFEVVNPAGEAVGRVIATRDGVAQDLLIVESATIVEIGTPDSAPPKGRRFPIPFVREIVTDVDEDNRRLVVDLPPGLDEL